MKRILKTSILFLPILLFSSCAAMFLEPITSSVQQSVRDSKRFCYTDGSSIITLKTVCVRQFIAAEPDVYLAYQVKLNEEQGNREARSVYLRILDDEGYQLEKKFLGNLAKGYKAGCLKGNIGVTEKTYLRMRNAELTFASFD